MTDNPTAVTDFAGANLDIDMSGVLNATDTDTHVDVSEDGDLRRADADRIDFRSNLQVTDLGDGTVAVDASGGTSPWTDTEPDGLLEADGFAGIDVGAVRASRVESPRVGTETSRPVDLVANGGRALRLEPTASAPNVIGGDGHNEADTQVTGATVGGGGDGTVAGRNAIYDNFGTVGGGVGNQAGTDDFFDFQEYATVGGGRGNVASMHDATIGGGHDNTADGRQSAIAGGWLNTTSGPVSTVSGGLNNEATGSISTVGGGQNNSASGSASVVSGGWVNTATGRNSAVVGGLHNDANGDNSTVCGGWLNTANGTYSYAAGRQTTADHHGAFVWGDGADPSTTGQGITSEYISSTGPNQFIVRARGGVWFGDNSNPDLTDGFINTSTGAYLSNGGTWTNASSRELKQGFEPVDADDVLERVEALPVSSWRYRADGDGTRHLGPVAEDFHGAFGLGEDDRHIAALDLGGVALAAIQGLADRLASKNERIDDLETENVTLKSRLETLEAQVAALAA